jgi:hypothetical protein
MAYPGSYSNAQFVNGEIFGLVVRLAAPSEDLTSAVAEFVEQAVYLADRISFDQGVLSWQQIDQYSAALSSALSDLPEIQGTTRYDDDSGTFVIGLPVPNHL